MLDRFWPRATSRQRYVCPETGRFHVRFLGPEGALAHQRHAVQVLSHQGESLAGGLAEWCNPRSSVSALLLEVSLLNGFRDLTLMGVQAQRKLQRTVARASERRVLLRGLRFQPHEQRPGLEGLPQGPAHRHRRRQQGLHPAGTLNLFATSTFLGWGGSFFEGSPPNTSRGHRHKMSPRT